MIVLRVPFVETWSERAALEKHVQFLAVVKATGPCSVSSSREVVLHVKLAFLVC